MILAGAAGLVGALPGQAGIPGLPVVDQPGRAIEDPGKYGYVVAALRSDKAERLARGAIREDGMPLPRISVV